MPANAKPKVLLIDLPTLPKGVVSLSLPLVAAGLSDNFEVTIIDLNLSASLGLNTLTGETNIVMAGLKVSAQSFDFAVSLTKEIKSCFPKAAVVWGGELPTLLPEKCLEHATTVMCGLFDGIAEVFAADLLNDKLQQIYRAKDSLFAANMRAPAFNLIKNLHRYYSFMGLPLETSRGCTEKCSFCMVHVMQKQQYELKDTFQLQKEIGAYTGQFINIVDYNFGVSEQHVIETAAVISKSGALGWMAEMCIEFLDNDRILAALRDSRCRVIYCGLETIDEQALRSVHKMNTNTVSNYERIIRKAQSYSIQVAAGVILGIEGMNERSFTAIMDFYSRVGVYYAKLTFLTYNPGTKVQYYMAKKGTFASDDITKYDGNHLSYIPNGVSPSAIYKGTHSFIKEFYSLSHIVRRSFNSGVPFLRQLEFILFNYCYSRVYFNWLKADIFDDENRYKELLAAPLKKSVGIKLAEFLLTKIRLWQK